MISDEASKLTSGEGKKKKKNSVVSLRSVCAVLTLILSHSSGSSVESVSGRQSTLIPKMCLLREYVLVSGRLIQ